MRPFTLACYWNEDKRRGTALESLYGTSQADTAKKAARLTSCADRRLADDLPATSLAAPSWLWPGSSAGPNRWGYLSADPADLAERGKFDLRR